MMKRKHMVGLGIGIFALVLMTASASALITRQIDAKDDKPVIEKTATSTRKARREDISWNDTRTQQQPLPPCDDGNVVGKVLGGVSGGVVGSQVGGGSGKTAATIGGTLGGAYLGGEYIPTRNATCR
ncbi:MAG: glycine zipper 2TM domain-containing protein [Alphaproteobacteria bacterium]